ncbi:unnamed protein product, partial [Phaeothamnion confervicola]
MDGACRNGHLELAFFLHSGRSEGCSPEALIGAAGSGQLAAMTWLHQHRWAQVATTESLAAAMQASADAGHLRCLQWLFDHGGAWTSGASTRAIDGAAAAGHLEIVQWLSAHRAEGATAAAMD